MLVSSISTWRTPCSCSCKGGQLVMKSLSFCLSGKIFISPFFRTVLLDIVFLIGSFFFQHFEYIFPLPSSLYAEKFLFMILQKLPFTWPVLFSCCFQSSFFVFDFWQFDYNVWKPLWVNPSWSLLSFLNLYVHFLPQIYEVSGHYFST